MTGAASLLAWCSRAGFGGKTQAPKLGLGETPGPKASCLLAPGCCQVPRPSVVPSFEGTGTARRSRRQFLLSRARGASSAPQNVWDAPSSRCSTSTRAGVRERTKNEITAPRHPPLLFWRLQPRACGEAREEEQGEGFLRSREEAASALHPGE